MIKDVKFATIEVLGFLEHFCYSKNIITIIYRVKADLQAMTIDLPRWVHFDVVKEYYQDRPYRLWRGPPITAGNPIIILVHGAVVPLPGAFHDPTTINNNRYCFYDLDSMLHQEFQYNVFTFEYADECVRDPITHKCFRNPFTGEAWYFNYGDVTKYGDRLKDAVGLAKEKSKKQDGTVGTVTIIAHSLGGLVARYAAKQAGMIDNIITLDTGHFGFGLANFVDRILKSANITLQGINCSQEVEEGSDFIRELNKGFNPDDQKLVSLAARDELPLPLPPNPQITSMRVVGFHSSSMGQVPDNGSPVSGNYNNPPFFVLPYNHVSISQITSDNYSNHEAYQKIKEFLQRIL